MLFMEILIVHSDSCIIGCDTIWSCRRIPMVWRNMLPPSSGLKCVGSGNASAVYAGWKETNHETYGRGGERRPIRANEEAGLYSF
jgi:hypothetical protein